MKSVYDYATTLPSVTNGAAIAAGAFSQETDIATAYTGVEIYADLIYDIVFAAAPAAGGYLALYRRNKNIKGTKHMPVPDASFEEILVQTIACALITAQTLMFEDVKLKPDCEFYIKNGADQQINAGWTQDVNPLGFTVA